MAAYRAAGGTGDVSTLAGAIEIIHTYSLVHDDLPSMDNDDMRRGRPATHRAYGVDRATLTGALMVPLTIRTAVLGGQQLGLGIPMINRIVGAIVSAAGAAGMVGGQLLDLQGETQDATLQTLEQIHSAKTGALIGASVEVGAVAAGASDLVVAAFREYGALVGLSFQITDDVLDATSTSEQLGKTVGRDAALGKSTYPGLLGVEGARARARALTDRACEILNSQDMASPELISIARFASSRAH
jgi:geranylgeranyl diphosphate synthase, type II